MIKAALVNNETEIVENIIIVNTLDDVVPAGYTLVEIVRIEIDFTDEEKAVYDFLAEIDTEYVYPEKQMAEPFVEISVTKWNETEGFH
jgi:hypothetical protein